MYSRRIRIHRPIGNQHFFLSTTGPFGDGQSASRPLDASTQPKLDAIWAKYLDQGTSGNKLSLYYAPGLYQTKGAHFNRPFTAFSGNYHYGSGQSSTIIQLVGASDLTQDGTIFSDFAQAPWVSGWGCFDMTLDCNSINQPKWIGSGGATAAIAISGGDNITIQRVTVINFGTITAGRECFPISVFARGSNPQARTMFNILIDSCTMVSPTITNNDGCTAIAINDNPQSTNGFFPMIPTPIVADGTCTISNCNFLDLSIIANFSFVHCASAPTVINNFARNCQTFFYDEPPQPQFPGQTIVIQNNICQNVNRLAFVLFDVGRTFIPQLTNVLISGNTITYPTDNSQSVGVQLTGGGIAASPSALVNLVSVRNNSFQSYHFTGLPQNKPSGVLINESGNLDMTISEVDVVNNYFTGFDASNNAPIILDTSTNIIKKQITSPNAFN